MSVVPCRTLPRHRPQRYGGIITVVSPAAFPAGKSFVGNIDFDFRLHLWSFVIKENKWFGSACHCRGVTTSPSMPEGKDRHESHGSKHTYMYADYPVHVATLPRQLGFCFVCSSRVNFPTTYILFLKRVEDSTTSWLISTDTPHTFASGPTCAHRSGRRRKLIHAAHIPRHSCSAVLQDAMEFAHIHKINSKLVVFDGIDKAPEAYAAMRRGAYRVVIKMADELNEEGGSWRASRL